MCIPVCPLVRLQPCLDTSIEVPHVTFDDHLERRTTKWQVARWVSGRHFVEACRFAATKFLD
jgi:hypothetical protein